MDIRKRMNQSSQFVNFNENYILLLERLADLPPQTRSTPYQKILIDNHTDAKKVKYKEIYIWKIFLDFAKFLGR